MNQEDSTNKKWEMDVDFCIWMLENEVPMKATKKTTIQLSSQSDPIVEFSEELEYIHFRKVKMVDNPDHKTTLNNLYKRREIIKNLK